MKLPNGDRALVPLAKLVNYLLSESHPTGRSKARFFRHAGFHEENADLLEQGLRMIAATDEVTNIESSRYGVKYVIDGSLATPLGGSARLRTIWIVESGLDRPRLVTAYPAPAPTEAKE